MRGTDLLHPEVERLALKLVDECEKKGLLIKITDTLRTKEEQDALYAQGRTKAGKIVTNVKYPASNHCWGIAFDFCRNDGKGAYEDRDGFFTKVGTIGKLLGLTWGGDFKSIIDKPHFEYQGYGTWRTLQATHNTPQKFIDSWKQKESGKTITKEYPYLKPTASLKKGSKGDTVKWVQYALNQKGFKLAIDGSFGSLTDTAVKKFQKDNKLVVDGIVGKNTLAKLQ